MESAENKSLALLRIKEILENYSDSAHLLTQADIIHKLDHEYTLDIDRKTVRRYLSKLAEAGVEVEITPKGCYLNRRTFEESELRVLIDSVLSLKCITPRQARDLVRKLESEGNVYFRKSMDAEKVITTFPKERGSSALCFTLDLLNEAISKKKKVSFQYGTERLVSPYRTLLSNGRYYLICYEEQEKELKTYPVEHLSDVRITRSSAIALTSLPGYEHGLNACRIYTMPTLSVQPAEHVVFETNIGMKEEVLDTFGKDVKMLKTDFGDDTICPEGMIRVSLEVSPDVMVKWALQHLDSVTVKSPENVRSQIKAQLEAGMERYKEAA